MAEPQTGRIGGGVLKDNLDIWQSGQGKPSLNFKSQSGDTALLHLDAENKLVAIKGNTSIPDKALSVADTIRSVNSISSIAQVFPYFTIQNNQVNLDDDILYLNAKNNIQLSALSTDDILIDDEKITTYNSNADLDIFPSGSGTTEILSDIDVYGSINATGNISMGGNLIFGQGPETPDKVSFGTGIKSNIVPDLNNTYSIGSPEKQVGTIYSNLLNGTGITAESLISGFVDLGLRQGNAFYVAENGSDTNVGNHPQGPFRTIKRALEAVDASIGGPVTIHVFPGSYEEELPLVVPPNVTISGNDLRNTIVRPESAYQSEDVFHITGEVTIENLTIKDFYYDSLNDKGYAFRYAPNAIVTSRSPYIRDITVITKGTTTSVNDPRGFASGDAGKGVLLDGSVLDQNSISASCLFHAVTFITPGVDAITLTNGVRIEWLNSFTYFANRGFYATNGTGRTLADGSTLEYGAEVRSIGSASVYGNYGAVADGDDVIMYLINHNFAYIGVGSEEDNDRDEVLEDQQWIEINDGKVYVQNTDERGKFKVGDDFFVDFDLGTVSIDTSTVDLDGLSQILVSDGDNTTTLNTNFVETGNIRFDGDTVFSNAGNIEIDSVSGTINFTNDVNVSKNLDITGDLTIDGALITFGNQSTDVVDFNVPMRQNINPETTSIHSLGSASILWKDVYLDLANFDNIRIFDNVITTTISNANLDLKSNSNGYVQLEGLEFQDDTLKTVDTNIELTTTGNVYLNAEGMRLPVGDNTQRIENEGSLRFSSEDNVFEGWGDARISFGGVYSDDRRTSIVADKTNNFININVNNNKVGEINNEGLTLHGLQSDSVFLNQNLITSNDSDADLWLRRRGTGQITLNGQEYFRNNIWTNPSTENLTIFSTDRGYVKIGGTYGAVLGVSGTTLNDNINELSIGTDISGSVIWNTDNAVRIDQGIDNASGNGTAQVSGNQVVGSTSTGTQNYFIDFGIDDVSDVVDIEITRVRFRGNFEASNEYVDLILPRDTSGTYTTRIGEFEDSGNTTSYTTSNEFGSKSKDLRTYTNTGSEASGFATQVVIGLSGNYGINIDVDVPSTLNTLVPGMTNNWELEISYTITTVNNKFEKYNETTNNYYYMFDEDSSNLLDKDRYIVTDTLDLSNFTRGRLYGKLILGNGSNGSREYNGENILLQFSDDGTNDTGMLNLGVVLNTNNAASYTIWNDFEVFFDITDSTVDLSNVKFRLVQTGGGEKGSNAFAIADLQLYLSETTPDSKPPGTFRYDAANKQAEVWDGTQWIPATGFEVDPVTDELMEEVVGIWGLILG